MRPATSIALILSLGTSAWAGGGTFNPPVIKVVEVFPGTEVEPNAQFVILEVWAPEPGPGMAGETLRVHDAGGNVIGSFTFGSNPANLGVGAKVLIATTEAWFFFGAQPDLLMTPVIPAVGGAVCWRGGLSRGDCVAWGSYGGALPSHYGIGMPWRPCATVGIDLGSALERRPGIDTNNSLDDFVLGQPAPINNAGVAGIIPTPDCGNGLLQALEGCDDNNTVGGDGCSAACEPEGCGNCVLDSGEGCDPPTVGFCSAACQLQAGNLPGEVSAPGSLAPLRFTALDTLSWQSGAAVGATAFNVYRGPVVDMRTASYGGCFAGGVPTNTTQDASGPAIGTALAYIVTGTNAAGEGSPGTTSAGATRTILGPCP